MKVLLKYSLFLAFILLSLGLQAQDKFLDKGNKAYENLAYSKAIKYYEKYLKNNFRRSAVENLADSYRLVSDFKNASKWYRKLVNLKQVDPETYLRYGLMLMTQEKYEESREWIAKFTEARPEDPRGQKFLADLDNMQRLYRDSARYTLKKLKFNSGESDFSPAFYKNGIVFTSARPRFVIDSKDDWKGEPFFDLWYIRMKGEGESFGNPKPFKSAVNTKFHDATGSFDKDGSLIFFTRSNVENGKKIKDEEGVVHLKTYYGDVEEDGWKNLRSLPFNSDNYSVGHPSLSFDGKVLFFISDMPGGFGGTDIYYSLKKGDAWSDPVNLGPGVNTPGNEMFPFIHESGKLWFASNGHGGLGGLDVFHATWDSVWTHVENPGAPVNSPADDFGLVMDPYQTYGFVSSNREGGKGGDDIYHFEVNRPVLEAVVVGLLDTLPVEGAKVVFEDPVTQENIVLKTSATGKLSTWLEKDRNYKMKAIKPGYLPFEIDFSTEGIGDKDRLRDTFWLDQPPLFLVGYAFNVEDSTPVVDADIKIVKENAWMVTNQDGFFSTYLNPKMDWRYHWENIDNPDCREQELPALCYRFFEEGMLDVDTTQFEYMWDLGDGTQITAAEVEYCYKEPGNYLVQLNLVDTLTGDIAFNEVTYQLDIPDPGRGYIMGPDTATLGNPVSFVLDEESLGECNITGVQWDLGDGTLGRGRTVSHTYAVPGTYQVKIDLETDDAEEDFLCDNCVFKRVTVIPAGISKDSLYKIRPMVYLDPNRDYFFRVSRPGFVPTLIAYRPTRLTGTDTIKVGLTNIPDRVLLKGVAFNATSKEIMRDIEIRAINNETNLIEYKEISPDGSFEIPLRENISYSLEVRKDGYLTEKISPVTVTADSPDLNMELEFPMEKVEIGRTYVLKNIYYDFDEAGIRWDAASELDKVVDFLKDNPRLVIEMSSHTDSRGNDHYNLELSQKRAQAATDYLLDQGIGKDRVVAIGYGEKKLVNQCRNGVPCAEEFHQQNRRTEFTIIGYDTLVRSEPVPVQHVMGVFMEGGYTLAQLVEESGEKAEAIDVFAEESEAPVHTETPGNQKVYSVQLAYMEGPVDPGYFEKLGEYASALIEERLPEATRYRVGNVRSPKLAGMHMERIRKKGYEDAFMIRVNPATGFAEKVEPENESEPSAETEKLDISMREDKLDVKKGKEKLSVSGNSEAASPGATETRQGPGNSGEKSSENEDSLDESGRDEVVPEIDDANDRNLEPTADFFWENEDPEEVMPAGKTIQGQSSQPDWVEEVFMIQIAAISDAPDAKFYNLLGEYRDLLLLEPYGKMIRCRVGTFESKTEAEKALEDLKELGFQDAFMIPMLRAKGNSPAGAR